MLPHRQLRAGCILLERNHHLELRGEAKCRQRSYRGVNVPSNLVAVEPGEVRRADGLPEIVSLRGGEDDKQHMKRKLSGDERAAGQGLEVGIGTAVVVVSRAASGSRHCCTMIGDSRPIEDSILTKRRASP